jgi:DNA-directed RNA polymerase specialized sigma24 family protein
MPEAPPPGAGHRTAPQGLSFLADFPDDPPAEDESVRREAADRALAAVSDDELGRYARRLIARGIKRHRLAADVAEDLSQEAIVRMLAHKRKWDPRRVELYTFLKGVLQSLANAYYEAWENTHFVHLQRLAQPAASHMTEPDPEGNFDPYENLAGPADGSAAYTTNAERLLLAEERWEDDKADFKAVTTAFADYDDAMAVIRAAQKGIVKANEQAEVAKVPVGRVYVARKRIGAFLRELWKDRDEKPRLKRAPLRPSRAAAPLDKDENKPQNEES